jgi:hypothetical protein
LSCKNIAEIKPSLRQASKKRHICPYKFFVMNIFSFFFINNIISIKKEEASKKEEGKTEL